MRLLLDTHIFLWMHLSPRRLGRSLDLLADPSHDLMVSAATSWEIAIKWRLGRLTLPEGPTTWVPERMADVGAQPAQVSHRDALAVADLPPIHHDPFDRLLAVQSRHLDASLVTADRVFSRYDVELIAVDGG